MHLHNMFLKTIVIILLALLFVFVVREFTHRNQAKLKPTRLKTTLAIPVATAENLEQKNELKRLQAFASKLTPYILKNDFNSSICFLADMQMHSGKKIFFVYDLKNDSILLSGLVAHGSCNTDFLPEAQFSNVNGCGCSSLGRYKVSYKYKGQFGTAFKLYGLDAGNDHAFERAIVLHGYSCVPDAETYPSPICNSLGCPMVSYKFLEQLTVKITEAKKPVVLWMFN